MDYLDLMGNVLAKINWVNSARVLCDIREILRREQSDCLHHLHQCRGSICLSSPLLRQLLQSPINHEDVITIIDESRAAAERQFHRLVNVKKLPPSYDKHRDLLVWYSYYDTFLSGVQNVMHPRWFLPRNHTKLVWRFRESCKDFERIIQMEIKKLVDEARRNGEIVTVADMQNLLKSYLAPLVQEDPVLETCVKKSASRAKDHILELVLEEKTSRLKFPDWLLIRLVRYNWRDALLSEIEYALARKVF